MWIRPLNKWTSWVMVWSGEDNDPGWEQVEQVQ
jgi:hypothetical protein